MKKMPNMYGLLNSMLGISELRSRVADSMVNYYKLIYYNNIQNIGNKIWYRLTAKLAISKPLLVALPEIILGRPFYKVQP